jgi:hypothetical protein
MTRLVTTGVCAVAVLILAALSGPASAQQSKQIRVFGMGRYSCAVWTAHPDLDVDRT